MARWLSKRCGDAAGVAIVEYAITSGMWLVLIAGGLQISLIGAQYFSLQQITRDTARWVAINSNTLDSAVATRVTTTASTGLPGAGPSGVSSVAVSPSCTVLTGGKCSGRTTGTPISVTVTPNLARVMFLPTSFGLGPVKVQLPTSLGTIRMTATVE
jgi:hypothetical protein